MSKGDFAGITSKSKKVVPQGTEAFAEAAKVDGSKSVEKQKMRRLNVEVPDEQFLALKAKVAGQGLKLNTVVNEWINEYLIK